MRFFILFIMMCSIKVWAFEVYYNDTFYRVPDHPTSSGLLNFDRHTLTVNYGPKKALRYITFSIIKDINHSDCTMKQFLEVAVLAPKETMLCGSQALQLFRITYPNMTVWHSKNKQRYYLWRSSAFGPMALKVVKDDRVLKVESSFMNLDALKRLLNSGH